MENNEFEFLLPQDWFWVKKGKLYVAELIIDEETLVTVYVKNNKVCVNAPDYVTDLVRKRNGL